MSLRSLLYKPPRRTFQTVARYERTLLGLAAVFVALNRLTLAAIREDWVFAAVSLLVWFVCAACGHIVLSFRLPYRDPYIFPVVMLLSGWGITLVARLAPAFAVRQVMWVAVAVAGCLAAAFLPSNLRILRRFRYTWLILGLILLGATFIFGTNPSGSRFAPQLWLGFQRVFFQPSEVLKILLVIFLASYLAERREQIVTAKGFKVGQLEMPSMAYVGPLLLMWGFCVVLLVWQRDLGAATLFFLIFLAMLYVSTDQIGYVVVGVVLLLTAAAVAYFAIGLVRLRIETWWNPWPLADNEAFQIVQSLLALTSGGIAGQGVGLGSPTFVPVVHSDFVFAAIAEEWGFLGIIGTLGCLALIVLRGFRTAADNDHRPFHALLAAGLATAIGVQSLLIMAGTLRLVPLTGVTLPFVSYGGSSLLSSFLMVGLLLRVSDPVPFVPRRPQDTTHD